MSARAEWIVVGGPLEPWQRLGLSVVDGVVPLFGTGIRFDPDAEPGIAGWALSGLTDAPSGNGEVAPIDGLRTAAVPPSTPVLVEHAIGAIGLDHVVVTTDDLQRTCAAIESATGSPLRRVREVGEIRQGFHRLGGGGGLIVEVVERRGLPKGPAWFWGLVINVEDLDAAAEHIGPDGIGAVTPAVQPGRMIATVRPALGLGVPVALMTP